ncbi:MAG: beta-propeller fold lactonase family protein [Microbacterium sp.]
MRFWVGGWGRAQDGECEGVSQITAGDADSPLSGGALRDVGLATRAESPSWLAAHPTRDVVYAALEADGVVAAYARTGEATLVPLGAPADAGAAVCHLAVAPGGEFLIASCWGDGRVVHLPLRADGAIDSPVIAQAAVDPYSSRTPAAALTEALAGDEPVDLSALIAGGVDPSDIAALMAGHAPRAQEEVPTPAAEPRPSRAHCAVFLPGGVVATTDLGYDLVRFWRAAPSGLAPIGQVVLPFGCGPRHLLRHPSGHLFVATEFSGEVFVLRQAADSTWSLAGGVTESPAKLDIDTGAGIALSPDGEVVWVGLRGSDTIAVLNVRGQGDALRPVALVDSGVTTPRHHEVGRDALLVTGQGSHEIATLPLDARTGIPGRVTRRLSSPSPTHLLPVR